MTFEVSQLPYTRQGKVFIRLGKVLGPALAKLAEVASGKSLLDADMGDAVQTFFENLTETEFEQLQKDLFETAFLVKDEKLVNVKQNIDVVLSGHNLAGLQLLWFCIEVNWGDFASALAVFAPAAKKAGAPRSEG